MTGKRLSKVLDIVRYKIWRNSISRRLWIAMILPACAAPPVIRSHRPPTLDYRQVVEQIYSRNKKIQDLSGFGKFRIQGKAGKLSGTAVINIKKKASLRLEFLNLFSQPIQYFLANERHLFLYTPAEKRAITGRPDAKNVNRLIGLRMGIAELISFFLGVPPDGNRGSQKSITYETDTNRYHLKTLGKDGGVLSELWVVPDTFSPVRYRSYDKEGNIMLLVVWDNFRRLKNISIATRIFIELPREKTNLEVRYTDFDINKGIAPDVFSLKIPPEAHLVSLGL